MHVIHFSTPTECTPPRVNWDGLINYTLWVIIMCKCRASQVAPVVKNPFVSLQDTQGIAGLIPGLGRSPGERMATCSSILAWKVPWTEEPDWKQSMRVAKSWTRLSAHTQCVSVDSWVGTNDSGAGCWWWGSLYMWEGRTTMGNLHLLLHFAALKIKVYFLKNDFPLPLEYFIFS